MITFLRLNINLIAKTLRIKTASLWLILLAITMTSWGTVSYAQTRAGSDPTETESSDGSTDNNSTGNSNTSTINDPVLQRYQEELLILQKQVELLQKQNEILTEEEAIVGAERTTFDNLLPRVTEASKPLEGKVEGSNNLQAESRFMIADGVEKIAATINKRIPKNSTVIIYDDDLLKFLSEYRLIIAQMDLLNAKYAEYFPEIANSSASDKEFGAIPASQALRGFEGLTRVTRSVIDFLALFRTKREFFDAGEINFLTKDVLASSIAGTVSADKNKKIDVYYPKLYTPMQDLFIDRKDTSSDSLTFSTPNNKSIKDLLRSKQELNALLERGKKKQENIEPGIEKEALKELNTATEELLNSLDIATVVRGLRAYDLLQQEEQAYILYLKLIYAVGNNQASSNLFSGTTIRHSGNVLLSYILFDKDGMIYNSDLLYYHSGFEKFKSPRDNFKPLSSSLNDSEGSE